MRNHYRKVRSNRPIVIETVEGLIEVHWANRGRRSELLIVTPDDMHVCSGVDAALKVARHVRQHDGVTVPAWELLVPKVNEQGELAGATAAPIHTINASAPARVLRLAEN